MVRSGACRSLHRIKLEVRQLPLLEDCTIRMSTLRNFGCSEVYPRRWLQHIALIAFSSLQQDEFQSTLLRLVSGFGGSVRSSCSSVLRAAVGSTGIALRSLPARFHFEATDPLPSQRTATLICPSGIVQKSKRNQWAIFFLTKWARK